MNALNHMTWAEHVAAELDRLNRCAAAKAEANKWREILRVLDQERG